MVELIDGVFQQHSIDNALVAITADYPGLCPASQVSTTEVLTPLLFKCLFLTTVYRWCLAGGAFTAGSRACGDLSSEVSAA